MANQILPQNTILLKMRVVMYARTKLHNVNLAAARHCDYWIFEVWEGCNLDLGGLELERR